MPILVTFDIRSPSPQELNRIRGFFERLGWEHLGNTAYRYPKLHGQQQTEDWFNHVIPALMMLRTFARHAAATGRALRKFTLDVQSSTGFNLVGNIGVPPLSADQIDYSQPSRPGRSFAQQRLQTWMETIRWPYQEAPEQGPSDS